ncbi:hypothetical protein [Alicyclobacillus fodiniaquatilis]|uniref:Uncharacterized protein n=1 Tax=Alicyclobacillus fodiniaquatilis TaxID=1661150 RepID=A0ABW4JMF2_9BACL
MSLQQLDKPQIEALLKAQVHEEVRRTPEGFAIFNSCAHTLIDLSGETEMHTVSLKLRNGDCLTFCVIPHDTICPGGGCVDIQYQGTNTESTMIGFTEGKRDERMSHNLYSLDYKRK